MNLIRQCVGLTLASIVVMSGSMACVASRDDNGTVVFEAGGCYFSPTTLEEALHACHTLLRECLLGTDCRCSPDEIDDLRRAIRSILRSKDAMLRPASGPDKWAG